MPLSIVKKVTDILGSKDISTKETFEFIEIYINGKINIPDSLSPISELVNERDKYILDLKIGDNDSIIHPNSTGYDFLQDARDALKIVDEEEITLTIRIEKPITNANISVYSIDSFCDYLESLSIYDRITVISDRLSRLGYIILELQNEEVIFKTNTIHFSSLVSPVNPPEVNETLRAAHSQTVKNLCHNNFQQECHCLPEDFQRIEESSHPRLNSIFDKLSSIVSMSHLFDILSIDKNSVSYSINGYRTIGGPIDLDKIDKEITDEYYKIYQWCYGDGNIIDKIGIIRNVLSLNIDHIESPIINGKAFHSIISNYNIYRKENIKQYVDIRNNISSCIIDFKNKADEIVDNFAKGFKNSLIGVVSFFASVIIIQVLQEKSLNDIFSLDITLLSCAFLVASFIYYVASKWEINSQKKRYMESYSNMKKRNKDLLDENDIDRILDNDIDYNANIEFIDAKTKSFSRLWIGTISILCVTILFLFFITNPIIPCAVYFYLLILAIISFIVTSLIKTI